jgi:phosphoglycolate phosphatase
MRYSLIVFDWDGTLIDSAAGIVECIQLASREMGLPVPDEERARHVIGLGLHDSLRIAVPDLPSESYGEFAALYRKNFLAREESMQLFPGVREMLVSLRRRERLLAVATGKSRRGLDRALEANDLGAHFAASRCGDETHPKPHPAMLLELMEHLSVEPARVLMIGDTSHDLQMARNAGVDALGVSYGAHSQTALQAVEPRGCVASVRELSSWLERHA